MKRLEVGLLCVTAVAALSGCGGLPLTPDPPCGSSPGNVSRYRTFLGVTADPLGQDGLHHFGWGGGTGAPTRMDLWSVLYSAGLFC